MFGVIDLDNLEIFSYSLMFYGISSVYISMGKNRKLQLFVGTSVFLTGIVLFLVSDFEIFNSSRLLFPSIILILGISCFMLFLDNTGDKAILFISLIFLLLGSVYSVSFGGLRPLSFLNSLYYVAMKYWFVIILTIVIILFFRRDGN